MSAPLLIVEQEGAIKRLRFNRPEKRNALNLDLADLLLDAVTQAATDGTRLLVLRGNGAGFCAGFDFSQLDDASPGDLLLQLVRIEQTLQALAHAPFDTLALVHGDAIGAGAEILVACRHRIGSANARTCFPGARFGLILGSRRLAQCVGPDAAQALIGSLQRQDAARLQQLGLLNEVVEQEAWADYEKTLLAQVTQVPAPTRTRVLAALRADTRAQDMCDLAHSAAQPGLKQRIADYRASLRGS